MSHKIAYIKKRFSAASMRVIDQANQIITEYTEQNFVLTLRQLYYQFVARDLLPNTQRQYNRLGAIINDARLAGYIDWTAIEDRTRRLERNSHWTSPSDILEAAAKGYAIDKWASQEYRVEVWIEKEALAGVIADICSNLDVDFLCCRGYISQSIMWQAGQRFLRYIQDGQHPVILHLGDHDPSGIDMSRDILDRIELLTGARQNAHFTFKRIALSMEQIEEHNPPPNWAKVTDSRFKNYADKYGTDSFELDALEPRVLIDLIDERVAVYRDESAWTHAVRREDAERKQLQKLATAAKAGGMQQ